MKKIQNWENFNELNYATWARAAKKAEEEGHKRLAKKFRAHPEELSKQMSKKRWKHIEQFDMVGFSTRGSEFEIKFIGEFRGIDLGMAWDMWEDNGKQGVDIPVQMTIRGDKENATSISMVSYDFSPFWLSYGSWTDNKVKVQGPFNVEESPWGDQFDEGEGNGILCTHRKDGRRLLNLIKGEALDDEIERLKGFNLDEGDFEEFIEFVKEALDNVRPAQLCSL